MKQVAALETEVYTVTTHSFFESLRPLVRHDVEPIVSRVINDVPKLDMTLGIRFGSEGGPQDGEECANRLFYGPADI